MLLSKLLAKVSIILDRIITLSAVLAMALIAGAMLIVSLDVGMRYFLHRPTLWVMPISEYMMSWFTFLGAAWILKGEGHVKIEILVSKLNLRRQSLLGIISSLIGVIICLVLVVYGIGVTWGFFRTGMIEDIILGLPRAPLIMVIPIGSLLLLIQFVRRGYGYWGQWRKV